MKNKKTSSFVIAISIMLVGLIVFSSCESSRVGPELPQPNPPVPPAQPLVLQGTVIDDQTHIGIAGAAVSIAKVNGTVIAALTTDGSGIYSTSFSAQTDSLFIVSATATGYGSASTIAAVSKKTNSASVSPVSIAKIAGTTVTVTQATGGNATTPPTTESATTTPVSVSVPPNAVTTNTPITISAVPIDNVPPFSNATQQVLLVVANVAPAGLTFNPPVSVTFPLPLSKDATTQLSAVKLNTTTSQWENLTAKGTVDGTGTVASIQVTSTGTYALIDDNTTIDVSGITLGKISPLNFNKLSKVLDEKSFSLSSGSTTISLTYNNTYVRTSSVGRAPTDAWIMNQLSLALHIVFGNYIQTFSLNFPQLPDDFQRNGVQYNPNLNTESEPDHVAASSGSWEYRWYYSSFIESPSGSVEKRNAPTFKVTFRIDRLKWQLNSKTGWYWIAHNQGGVGSGPY